MTVQTVYFTLHGLADTVTPHPIQLQVQLTTPGAIERTYYTRHAVHYSYQPIFRIRPINMTDFTVYTEPIINLN